MRRSGIVVGLLAALAAGVLVHGGPSFARGEAASPPRTVLGSFRSRALHSKLHFLVRLPSGYSTSGRRYPVVYFLHGLPAAPTSYEATRWLERAVDHVGRNAILVVPQGTRLQNGDPEYLDLGPGYDWASAIGAELPAYVDAHYRTIASRAGRALVGISAGGYGAASIGLKHPGRFSVVESWSGYFVPTDPTGTFRLDLGSTAANKEASIHHLVRRLPSQFRRYPTFFAFYVGRSDPTFVQENVLLNEELNEAHVPHTFVTYPGGHSVGLWETHAATWLGMALRRLA